MTEYKCRRNKMIEVNDDRLVIKNVLVLDSLRGFTLFDECTDCGYGRKMQVLKSRKPPYEYYDIKSCTLKGAVKGLLK